MPVGGLYRRDRLDYTAPMELLNSTPNPFGGIIPDPTMLPVDAQTFAPQLKHSLQTWTSDGYKLVWLEVPLQSADLVPVAASEGFTFHHADQEYVMMLKELEKGAFVPNYSTHYIGAGGVVISNDNEILVVRERRGGGASGSFKLPGGHVHEGEHIAEAVVREVLEETGIQSQFVSLVCFRHQHGYRHGKSDIYFVCRLEPLSKDIVMQDEEIAECIWMPVDEYLSTESVSMFNQEIVRAAIDSPGLTPTALEGYRDPAQVEVFFPRNWQQKG
jgi:mutator protein MutT